MKLMFDTNIFNAILDGQIGVSEIKSQHELYVTHIQEDEIKATKRDERRNQLLAVFKEVSQSRDISNSIPTEGFVLGVSRLDDAKLSSKVPTETMVWDTSNWGEAKWGTGDFYEKIKNKLDKRNKNKSNNTHDALIAETAMVNGYVLVTHDGDLFSVVSELGGSALNLPMIREGVK